MTNINDEFLDKTLITEKPGVDGFSDGLIYAGIAFTVILFNLIAILGLDILLHDDPANYTRVINGQFPWWMLKDHLISPFTEWIGWNIMAYSPKLARGLYVLLLMVPLSCCFYHLCRHRLGFSRMTAYTAAILPNILPMQWQIPAGINMSYVLWGLLVSLVSLILGLHYLENNTEKNWSWLAGAFLCYLAATQIMEQALFLFPPFVLAFWGYKKFAKKNILLLAGFTIIAVIRLIQTIVNPRGAAVVQSIPLDEIVRRISLYFQWSLPFPNIDPVYLLIGFFGVIFVGFIQYLKPTGAEPKTSRVFLYILLFVWAISAIFVFIFMSRDYPPRYVYISSFGLNAVFVFSAYVILKNLSHGKIKWHIPVFAVLIIFSGVSRYFKINEMYTHMNTTLAIVQRDLNKMQLPPHSQIVITGLKGIPGGWRRSSGYLQFALKRNDVNGLVGPVHSSEYYNFDNHFDPQLRMWDKRSVMTGLSLKKPLFLFYFDSKNGKLKPFEYALQWRGEKNDAPWTILRVDKTTGAQAPCVSGVGMEEYVSAIQGLQKNGIPQSEILWGGPPTKEEQKRLEVN